jgi:methionyl aminopeptidase
MFKPGLNAMDVDAMCAQVAQKHNVLCGFKGQYGFPHNICISINDVVAHGRPHKDMIFKEGDLVNFDF